MTSYVQLPREPDALADAIRTMVDAACVQRSIIECEWRVAHYYLQGYRKFDINFMSRGQYSFALGKKENRGGEIEFRDENLTLAFRIEVGRLLRAKMGPTVDAPGFGLSAVRDASVAQAVLSFMRASGPSQSPTRLQQRFAHTIVKLGTAGLCHYRCPGTDFGSRTCIEVVPPSQILFMPAEMYSLEEQTGIMRHRYVPYEWIMSQAWDEKFQKMLEKADDGKLEVIELEHGENPMLGYGVNAVSGGGSGYGGHYSSPTSPRMPDGTWDWDNTDDLTTGGQKKKADRKYPMQKWVPFTEVWNYSQFPEINRAVVKVGSLIARDEEVGGRSDQERAVCPLAVARYADTDSAYGRGFPSLHIGFNTEIERLYASQFANVRDIDYWGITVIPTSTGLRKEDVQKPERRKVLMAESDPMAPNDKPFNMHPETSGTLPAEIIKLAAEARQRNIGQTELYSGDAPGRVDSAAALGFIFETGNVNLAAVVNDMADAYAQVYATMLHAARLETVGLEEGTFPLSAINERMLGLSLTDNGQISIEKNPIPYPWKVRIDVQERALQSEQQAKQEGLLMLQSGVITMAQFRILNEKNRWGYPITDRSSFEAWRRTVLQAIFLFNDGVTPGKVKSDHEHVNFTTMLEVINTVIATIEFAFADKAIHDAFITWKKTIENAVAQFPEQLPNPIQQPMAGGGMGQEMTGPPM